MKYHDTVPSERGLYRTRYGVQLIDSTTKAFSIPPDDFMLGPLPTTPDEAIALACEVQFARMCVADYQWCSGNGTGPTTDEATRDVMPRLSDCEHRFVRKGERSLSLYRDMERVAGELGGAS